ncbi:MAG: hypothetical protein ACR2MG_20865 [Pyrinomonadaceae bacterium]
MAAKKTAAKKNTSLVANPGGSSPVARAKATTTKTNAAQKTAGAQKTSIVRKKAVRRNPTGSVLINTLIAAFGGALAITGFDFTVNYFMPQISTTVRTLGKFGAGFLVGQYGKKLPLIGSYAGGISNTLYLFGFVDLLANHVVPRVLPLLSQRAASTAAPKIVQTASGEMGALIDMPDGSQAVLIDETGYIDNPNESGNYYENNYQSGYGN